MECPAGCDCMQQSCPIRVDDQTYVDHMAEHFGNHQGVASCTTTTVNGTPAMLLTIDEDAYETRGHFRNRRQFETSAAVTLHERDDGKIAIVREASNVITAMQCPNCDTVYEPDLEVVFDNPETMY